jgi:hypothetical protein
MELVAKFRGRLLAAEYPLRRIIGVVACMKIRSQP